jgi:LPXTG-motif cell wall-anchored protein
MLSSQLMSSLLTSVNLKGEQMSEFKGRFGRWAKVLVIGALFASSATVLPLPVKVEASLGATWTDYGSQLTVDDPQSGNFARPLDAAIGGGKIVLVGAETDQIGFPVEGKNNIWVSNINPISFTALKIGSASGTMFQSVAYGNGVFLAVGSATSPQTPVVYSSADGVTWTDRTSIINFNFNNFSLPAYGDIITFDGTEFILLGMNSDPNLGTATNAFVTTSNGTTWSAKRAPLRADPSDPYFVPGQQQLMRQPSSPMAGISFAKNGSTMVFGAGSVPSMSSLLVTPDNGSTWKFGYDGDVTDANGATEYFTVDGVSTSGSGSTPIPAPVYQYVAYANGKFVGFAIDQITYVIRDAATSSNGLDWVTHTGVFGQTQTPVLPRKLVTMGSEFALVTMGEVFTSSDGATWTQIPDANLGVGAQQDAFLDAIDHKDGLTVMAGWLMDSNFSPVASKVLISTAAPTVTSVSPTSGSTAGGTAITITGTNLGNASTVTVGSAACTNVVVVSATSITCTTPPGTAGTASIIVTAGGQSNVANTLFTYNAPATTTTTTTAPGTTAPGTTAPATSAPATAPTSSTAPVGPVNVTSSNQASLTQTPGAATAVVNGQPVTVAVETPADLPAAQVDPEDRSPAQVAALQTAADNLVSQLNQAAGGNSGLAVQDTPTGAAITGLLTTPVPIENTVLVEAGTKSTLFAALNEDGSVTEVQPGAVIEVLGDGQVGVVASGLTPGETAEFVIMSTPTLLGSYTVSANGTIKAQTSLPDGIGLGNHTLVVASPTVQASLGLKVSATPSTLPATGASSSNTMQIALFLMVGGLMVAFLRRRRHILN